MGTFPIDFQAHLGYTGPVSDTSLPDILPIPQVRRSFWVTLRPDNGADTCNRPANGRNQAMNDTLIWAIAMGSGLLGLLLLAFTGIAAFYLRFGSHSKRSSRTSPKPASNSTPPPSSPPVSELPESAAPTTHSQLPPAAESPSEAPSGNLWLWVKAWIFAMLHATTVSLVVGGITFFEDLAQADEEMHTTGSVTFPKQLLPRPLAALPPQKKKRLAQPSRSAQLSPESSAEPTGSTGPTGTTEEQTNGWEVVGRVRDHTRPEAPSPPDDTPDDDKATTNTSPS